MPAHALGGQPVVPYTAANYGSVAGGRLPDILHALCLTADIYSQTSTFQSMQSVLHTFK